MISVNIKYTFILTNKESKEMVNSVSSISTTNVQSSGTGGVTEEEKKKNKEEGLFSVDDNQQNTQENLSSVSITEDSARTEAQSYINILKSQYPQLAEKLDTYYSNLNFETLCSEAVSSSDIRAYIYSETQSFFN